MVDEGVIGNEYERRYAPCRAESDPVCSFCSFLGLGIGNCRDDDPRQRRSAGGDKSQRGQPEYTFAHNGNIGESQPPGYRKGNNIKGYNLMAYDPIGEPVHISLLLR